MPEFKGITPEYVAELAGTPGEGRVALVRGFGPDSDLIMGVYADRVDLRKTSITGKAKERPFCR